MNLPFDAFPGADFIRRLSPDILPNRVREEQTRLKVPCLGEMGCRFLWLCAAMKQPEKIIDIGAGIGASTLSLHFGAPFAEITALEANKERAESCCKIIENNPRIKVYFTMAEDFLKSADNSYDLAFIDSVKKDYTGIWHFLRPKLNAGAVAIFDDVLLHGFTMESEATVPLKYREGRRELRAFLSEISSDSSLQSQIIPLDGGMLVVAFKDNPLITGCNL
ncbi:MAG: hypothetical protein LBH05_05705 [Deferribacteraceae bacterium]|jgi:predicted O-methyltransferase YrrM|nr:hypothetical protein [Deferribacteraceae bacterium]